MPDVLKIAMERREALLKEAATLERFINMANELLAQAGTDPSRTSMPRSTLQPAPVPAKSVSLRQSHGPATSASSKTEAFLKSHQITAQTSSAKTG